MDEILENRSLRKVWHGVSRTGAFDRLRPDRKKYQMHQPGDRPDCSEILSRMRENETNNFG